MTKPFNVCVFCGSNTGKGNVFRREAEALASGLASLGAGLVYGGASVGVMGILADTMLARGAKVFGVIPQSLKDMEVAHANLTELHVVGSMHQRKKLMFDMTDVFLTFPGGFGTLDETFEIMTWRQIGLHQKPLIFLNISSYFTPLLNFVDNAIDEGFVKPQHRQIFQVVNTSQEALALVAQQMAQR